MTDKKPGNDTETSRLDAARDATAEAYATAREKVGETLHDARDAASHAYEAARDRVGSAGQRLGDGVEANPWVALAGGVALGAVIGALLPRTARETALLGSLGARLNDAGRQAADAAKSAGQEKLDELGLTRDHARDTVTKLLGDVAKAAATAGREGLNAARQSA